MSSQGELLRAFGSHLKVLGDLAESISDHLANENVDHHATEVSMKELLNGMSEKLLSRGPMGPGRFGRLPVPTKPRNADEIFGHEPVWALEAAERLHLQETTCEKDKAENGVGMHHSCSEYSSVHLSSSLTVAATFSQKGLTAVGPADPSHLDHKGNERGSLRPSLIQFINMTRSSKEDAQKEELGEYVIDQDAPTRGSTAELNLHDGSVIEIISRVSLVGRIALFVGGFFTFENVHFQRAYDIIFISSFMICAISCASNMHTQAPPYYNMYIDLLTVYFHVVALHAWVFWRKFLNDKKTIKFVAAFFGKHHIISEESLGHFLMQVRVFAGITFFAQIFMVLLGYFCFSQPAIRDWSLNQNHLSLAHAIIMYLVIPSHVPTMIISICFFFFMSRLHMLDMGRAKHLCTSLNAPGEAGPDPVDALNVCVDLVDMAQHRLEHSCHKWQLLWMHHLFYAYLQCTVVASQIVDSVKGIGDRQWVNYFLFTYDLFHGLCGLSVFLAIIVTPAMVTHLYLLVPKKIIAAIRSHGSSSSEAGAAGFYMYMRTRGFVVLEASLKPPLIATFLSLCVMGTSAYVALRKMIKSV